jgi:CRP-like cAMP-binding protein
MSLLMSLQVLDHPKTTFKKGETIIREATPASKVFVLVKGAAEVNIQGQKIAQVDKAGELLGEIANIRGCNYGATVTTLCDSEFFVIDNFITYLKQNPDDSITVMKLLCERISQLNNNFIS